jgi:nucleoside-diphosphate-sugar epimerase
LAAARPVVILVTGGTGFVGRALVPALLQDGHRVRLLSRQTPSRLPPGAETVPGDLLDPASLGPLLDGITAVVHLAAALPKEGVPADRLLAVNVEGTRNLARAAGGRGVGLFVHGSSGGVYGDGADPAPRSESVAPAPGTPYERSKLEGERAAIAELSAAGVPWIVLRPSGIHGPGRTASATFYRQIQQRKVWVHGPARVIVHPTDVTDVVSAARLALRRSDLAGEIFNVAGPEPLEYSALIAAVGERLGVRPIQWHMPATPIRALADLAAATARAAGRGPVPALDRLRRTTVNRSLDITKAVQLLGFQPLPLVAGIDATIEWARRERLL